MQDDNSIGIIRKRRSSETCGLASNALADQKFCLKKKSSLKKSSFFYGDMQSLASCQTKFYIK